MRELGAQQQPVLVVRDGRREAVYELEIVLRDLDLAVHVVVVAVDAKLLHAVMLQASNLSCTKN